MQKKIVSVFGSSRPKPETSGYKEAYLLGELLARANFSVMTGGYGGTMEAVSKGAREGGALVIGVTTAVFEREGKRSGPNPYVSKVIRYETLSERLYHLISKCDAAVALSGGIGTFSEVAFTWSLLQTGGIAEKPLVLVGEFWKNVLKVYYGNGEFVSKKDLELISLVETPEEAVTLLQKGRRRN